MMERIFVGTAVALGVALSAQVARASDEAPIDAGPPTLFDGKMAIGVYGGLEGGYTKMLGRDGALAGMRFGLLLDHRLSIGLAGYGFIDPHDTRSETDRLPEVGYGGLTLHYSFYSQRWPVYVSVGGLVGGGAIEWRRPGDDDYGGQDGAVHDAFGVVQPELMLDLRVAEWMRVGVNAAYRFTRGVDEQGLDRSDLDGPVLGAHVQFGSF